MPDFHVAGCNTHQQQLKGRHARCCRSTLFLSLSYQCIKTQMVEYEPIKLAGGLEKNSERLEFLGLLF